MCKESLVKNRLRVERVGWERLNKKRVCIHVLNKDNSLFYIVKNKNKLGSVAVMWKVFWYKLFVHFYWLGWESIPLVIHKIYI